jgi:hypothetical protein
MTNRVGPAGGIGLLLLAMVAILLWLQPDSVFSPDRPYSEAARRFLRTALAHDSLGLQRQAVSPEPVRWALRAAREDSAALAMWAERLLPHVGRRSGDTTTVVFETGTHTCYLQPVTMTFVGEASGARVLGASSDCFSSP